MVPQPVASPHLFPDEYLCDGGDRGLPVHYDQFHRHGLDTEDTIAEYVDHQGTFHMKPTNRVCIYAPRFGAMRTVSGPRLDHSVEQAFGAHDAAQGVGLRSREVAERREQRERVDGMRVRSRPSGFDLDALPRGVEQHTELVEHVKLVNTFQDLAFVATGRVEQADKAWLAYGIQAAVAWTRTQFPVAVAQTAAAQQVIAEFQPEEIVGLEDRRKKGDLRIVKLADKKTAQPGDIVTFTIRYDNVGDIELYHVRIVDNLTPRLQSVDDSATSDRAGRLVVEDNEEGSLVLTFELDEPLPGRTGGFVTFQTRVR
jgi:uncharacterized repeat protein (TIGR01451 family)